MGLCSCQLNDNYLNIQSVRKCALFQIYTKTCLDHLEEIKPGCPAGPLYELSMARLPVNRLMNLQMLRAVEFRRFLEVIFNLSTLQQDNPCGQGLALAHQLEYPLLFY